MQFALLLYFFYWLLLFSSATPVYPENFEFVEAGNLPKAKANDFAVYDGHDSIFVLGGRLGNYDPNEEVYQYNCSTQVSNSYTIIPTPQNKGIEWGTAHMDRNGTIYYLGGALNKMDSVTHRREIYKITKENPHTIGPVALLPSSVWAHQSAFDEGNGIIYIFGGYFDHFNHFKQPMKYNIMTNTAELITTATYEGVTKGNVFINNFVYIFGSNQGQLQTDSIYKFDTGTETIIKLDVKLPWHLYGTSAVLVDDVAWILGEVQYDEYYMIRFNTTSETIIESHGLPNYSGWGIGSGSTVYVEKTNRIYIIESTAERDVFLSNVRYVQLPFDCTKKKNGLYPHQSDCSKFMSCSHGNEHEFTCPAPLYFNKDNLVCDWPENVSC